MADTITDYDSLVEAFGQYVERADLDAYAPKFVQLTENRLNRVLRVHDMQKEAALTVSNGDLTLPNDFLEWISAAWTSPTPARTLALRYVEADSPEFTYRHRPGGDPQYFSILAGKVRLKPAQTGNVTLAYYAKIPALTADDDTNWLVTRAPELYLYGMLAESYAFQKDEARAAEWMKMAEDRLQALFGEADVQKTGRRPLRAAEDAAEATARNTSR